MSYSEGGFVLRQILASSVVLGPLLLLIGTFYFIYRQDRKSVLFYVVMGVVLTAVGAACLYAEFREESQGAPQEERATQ